MKVKFSLVLLMLFITIILLIELVYIVIIIYNESAKIKQTVFGWNGRDEKSS